MRADSAGCTEGFLVGLSGPQRRLLRLGPDRNAQVTAAIFDAIGIEAVWLPALAQDGEEKDGAAVAELTSLIDDDEAPHRHPADRPA